MENYRSTTTTAKGFEVVIDAQLEDGAYIREMRSPSHPIAVSLGTVSTTKDADPTPNKASATLSLSTAELERDFVLQLVAKETSMPKAVLETHPTIPGQRALMATLVPKFNLPSERPEIVFVCDRSGSMRGQKIVSLRNALKVFLKSLPVGTKFNICSFGGRFSFLWPKSKSYSQASLDEAMNHVESFEANFGGTEMFGPMEETIKKRYSDMNLEIFLVTDGEIWDQQRLFDLLNQEISELTNQLRRNGEVGDHTWTEYLLKEQQFNNTLRIVQKWNKDLQYLHRRLSGPSNQVPSSNPAPELVLSTDTKQNEHTQSTTTPPATGHDIMHYVQEALKEVISLKTPR